MRIGTVFGSLEYARRLARHFKSLGADLIHTNSLKGDVLGGIAARIARIPLVWHMRDRIDEDYLPKPAVAMVRGLCRLLPQHVITNSAATLSTLRIPEKKAATVVHDGVMEEAFQDSQPSDPPVVGLVGRISPWKGQHIFIEAAKRVLQHFPRVRFKIIGSAMFGEEDYEARLREMIAEYGLQDSIELTGFRSDVKELIGEMSILVHASTSGEPFGQVVIEGMAAGKPVIGTDGGGVPEIIVNEETGLLVPMGDADSMAKAMESLLADPERATAMGLAGRVRVRRQFMVEHTARGVEAVYRRVLRR